MQQLGRVFKDRAHGRLLGAAVRIFQHYHVVLKLHVCLGRVCPPSGVHMSPRVLPRPV